MKGLQIDSETAMSVVHNCLVVTIPGEIHDDMLMRIRTDILETVQATKVRGLILDFSTVRALDTFAFNSFTDTAKMASLLGLANIFVGLQPGVVSALVDLEVEIKDVGTALTIEDAFEQLQDIASIQDEPEDDVPADNETIEGNQWERGIEEE
ncbi:MAG: STAS domain-containing protein [Deltaproteobacteria bacterium]|jgi:rsbT antagonist protein RsbS|nr:STAS domain-containing protein [Deltaproteobacteria bacterium]